MPRCSNQIELLEHFISTAYEHRVAFDWCKGYDGKAWSEVRYVRTPQITGPLAYFIGMHELGHCIDHDAGCHKDVIEREAAAWLWALDNSIIQPTPSQIEKIWSRFSSYFQCAAIVPEKQPILMEFANRLNKKVKNNGYSHNPMRNKKRERQSIRRQAIKKLKVGDTAHFYDDMYPRYLAGHEVKILKVKRTWISVKIMTAPVGRKFKAGMIVDVPAETIQI